MQRFSKQKISRIVTVLKSGGVGVLPTDTIYGIVGSALDEKTVARIYRLRHRNPKKPMIILIGNVEDLKLFGITINKNLIKKIDEFWPGKVSIIFTWNKRQGSSNKERAKMLRTYRYLHRDGGSIAFRLPKPIWLRHLLKTTGPLVAPSANLEGHPPAKEIPEARRYFGKKIDFYLNAGLLKSKPSTLLKIEKGKVVILRK